MKAARILVFCEQRAGRFKPSGLEALSRARELTVDLGGGEVIAVVGGQATDPLVEAVVALGPDRVLVASCSEGSHDLASCADILACLIEAERPTCVMMGATAMGKDLAPTLAARVRGALIQDCLELHAAADGSLQARREVYGGRLHEVVTARAGALPIITMRRTRLEPAVPAGESGRTRPKSRVESIDIRPSTSNGAIEFREFLSHCSDRPALAEAEIVVAGGRGLGSAAGFADLEELADLLQATVGASRAVVDDGWRARACQIGLTGRVIAPKLYIACGISGAVQHRAGITSARVIVAINTDPQAPIFKMASYGIVGDSATILPLLVEEIRRLKEAGEI